MSELQEPEPLSAERRELVEMDRYERVLMLRVTLIVILLALYVAVQIWVL